VSSGSGVTAIAMMIKVEKVEIRDRRRRRPAAITAM